MHGVVDVDVEQVMLRCREMWKKGMVIGDWLGHNRR